MKHALYAITLLIEEQNACRAEEWLGDAIPLWHDGLFG